jgi:hypothetical protein
MATSFNFAGSPRIGAVALTGTADTGYTSPSSVAVVITGVLAGTRINEVVVQMTGTVSSATMVRLWLYDGTTYFLFDEIAITAAAGSQSVTQTRAFRQYDNLVLPSSSWSLRATCHTNNAGNVQAHGVDY